MTAQDRIEAPADSLAAMQLRRLQGARAALVANLRGLADEIERKGIQDFSRLGTTPGAGFAADVIHKLSWGWANLNADTIVRVAGELDAALAREKENR